MDASTLRKAALLVASLDTQAADRLLEQMSPQQAAAVRDAVLQLGPVDPEEQRRVIAEFMAAYSGKASAARASGEIDAGIELGGNLAQPPRTSQPARSGDRADLHSAHRALPFRLLRSTEENQLAQVLASERPQTIAVVLSHLPHRQAGNVLARLPAALQVEVIRRLIELEETDEEILREIEAALESRLAQVVQRGRRRVAGLGAVAGILDAADRDVSSRILANLVQSDRALAEQLGARPLVFEDLLALGNAALRTLVEAADPLLLQVGLVGAQPALVDRVCRLLPESEAYLLRSRIDCPQPLRLSEVEEARRRLALLARRLILEGKIAWPGRQLSAAA